MAHGAPPPAFLSHVLSHFVKFVSNFSLFSTQFLLSFLLIL